jgi:hypothetical protein
VIVSVRHVFFQRFKRTKLNKELAGRVMREAGGCSLFCLTLHQYEFEVNTMPVSTLEYLLIFYMLQRCHFQVVVQICMSVNLQTPFEV